MKWMLTVAFLLLTSGFLLLMGITFEEIRSGFSELKRPEDRSIRSKIRAVRMPKKRRGLNKLIFDTKNILKTTNKENQMTLLIIVSLSLMVFGFFVALIMHNYFLIPVLAIGFFLLPFWYVKYSSTRWKKELNNELETALSIITTSYLRSESILTAIDENIDYINPPVQDVFKAFTMQTKLINSNIKMALESLKDKMESAVFHEWVDAIIDCQEDKNLKNTLVPIVSKLSDMRIVSAELDYVLYEPVKEYITMVILFIGNIPLLYFINRSWFDTLLHSFSGKLILALCFTILFISIAGVVRLSKPVEYQR